MKGPSLLILMFLGAAAAASTGGQAASQNAVHASVIAAKAGIGWASPESGALTVRVFDYDGTNDDYSWPSDGAPDAATAKALQDCLERLRWNASLADPDHLAQPHYIRTEAIRCFESSGVPPYVSVHQPDAQEYEVQVETGNIYKRTPPEQGARLYASGGPFLGGRRHIRADIPDATIVARDVHECLDEAAARGTAESTRLNAGTDSMGWGLSFSQTTIRPLLNRFDQCLVNRRYAVQPADAPTPAGKH